MGQPAIHFEIIETNPKALRSHKAESLGGTRTLGPARASTGLVVGHFIDPEGNLIGLAATA